MRRTLGLVPRPEDRGADVLALVGGIVLLIGCALWLFPQSVANVGGWVFPVLCITALCLAVSNAIEFSWIRVAVAVLVVTILGSAPVALASQKGVSHLTGVSLGLLAAFWVGRVVSTPRRLRWAAAAYLGGGLVTLLAGLTGPYFEELAPVVTRMTVGLPDLRLGLAGIGPFGYVNPNALAAAALLIVPMSLAVLGQERRAKADWLLFILALVVFAIGSFIIVVTLSKSAWLAIWLTLAAILVRGPNSFGWRLALGGILVAPLLIAAFMSPLVPRDKFLAQADAIWSTLSIRGEITAIAVEQFRASPWFGVGLNHFRNVYPTAGTTDVAHAHNMFMQTALDVGAIGLAAYCCLLLFLLIRADSVVRTMVGPGRTVAIGAAVSLLAITAFGLADAVPLGTKVGMLQWLLSGGILAAWRVQQTQIQHR